MLPELVSCQPLAVSPKISLLLLPNAVRTLPVSSFPSLTSPPLQAFSWLLPCALCFWVISVIVLVLWCCGLDPARSDPDKPRGWSSPAALQLTPNIIHSSTLQDCPPLPSKYSPSLPRGFSGQSKHQWQQGWPHSPLLLYLPSFPLLASPSWQSPGLVTRFAVLQIPLLQNKISWNTDTVNSGHCFCLIYRINNVEKEFKDVFQTGPSFF